MIQLVQQLMTGGLHSLNFELLPSASREQCTALVGSCNRHLLDCTGDDGGLFLR